MPCIGHNTQIAPWPFPRKRISHCRGTNHVIATLNNISLNMANFFHVIQNFLILIKKAIIYEIVVFNPRECTCIGRWAMPTKPIRLKRCQCIFPMCPRGAKPHFFAHIPRKQPFVICANQVITFILWDDRNKSLPQLGPEFSCAATVKPVQLRLCHQEDTPQDQVTDAVRMGLCINQR